MALRSQKQISDAKELLEYTNDHLVLGKKRAFGKKLIALWEDGDGKYIKYLLTLSLPVTCICIHFSTVYNDTLVTKG